VQEKVPVVTDKLLDAGSAYPQDGVIACEIVTGRKNTAGKMIFTVDTLKPWDVATLEGTTQFDVFEEQLTEL